MSKKLLNLAGYQPEVLVEHLLDHFHVRNDAALCRVLGMHAPQLCRIRKKKNAINGDMLLRIYDISEIPIDKIREIAGIPKAKADTKADDEFIESD